MGYELLALAVGTCLTNRNRNKWQKTGTTCQCTHGHPGKTDAFLYIRPITPYTDFDSHPQALFRHRHGSGPAQAAACLPLLHRAQHWNTADKTRKKPPSDCERLPAPPRSKKAGNTTSSNSAAGRGLVQSPASHFYALTSLWWPCFQLRPCPFPSLYSAVLISAPWSHSCTAASTPQLWRLMVRLAAHARWRRAHWAPACQLLPTSQTERSAGLNLGITAAVPKMNRFRSNLTWHMRAKLVQTVLWTCLPTGMSPFLLLINQDFAQAAMSASAMTSWKRASKNTQDASRHCEASESTIQLLCCNSLLWSNDKDGYQQACSPHPIASGFFLLGGNISHPPQLAALLLPLWPCLTVITSFTRLQPYRVRLWVWPKGGKCSWTRRLLANSCSSSKAAENTSFSTQVFGYFGHYRALQKYLLCR